MFNFARFLYPNNVDKITLPEDENFLIYYHSYQEEHNYSIGNHLVMFDNPLNILHEIFNVDTPSVSLVKEGRALRQFQSLFGWSKHGPPNRNVKL